MGVILVTIDSQSSARGSWVVLLVFCFRVRGPEGHSVALGSFEIKVLCTLAAPAKFKVTPDYLQYKSRNWKKEFVLRLSTEGKYKNNKPIFRLQSA